MIPCFPNPLPEVFPVRCHKWIKSKPLICVRLPNPEEFLTPEQSLDGSQASNGTAATKSMPAISARSVHSPQVSAYHYSASW